MSIARTVLLRASRSPWLAHQMQSRGFARRAVRRFMPGEQLADALNAAAELHARHHIGAVLTQLGERVRNPTDAAAVRDHYLAALDEIRARAQAAELSVKLTHLGLDADVDACSENLRALAARATVHGATLWIDMEEAQYVERTLALVRATRASGARVGVCLQAYLHRTPQDLEELCALGVGVRLVKGAYAEPPEVALRDRAAIDARYAELADRLLAHSAAGAPPAVFGTHDLRLVEHVRAGARNRTGAAFEIHMLYGIQSAAQRELAAAAVPVRVLISYGSAWFPWFMRRLAERPANVLLLLRNLR